MSGSRISWALSVVAPWCMGLGLVISFTADAGQDVSIGASWAVANARAPEAPFNLMPPAGDRLVNLIGASPGARSGGIHLASLHLSDLGASMGDDDGDRPRAALKRNVRGWPTPDRSHKGDPSVGLRPTFDAKLRQPGGLGALRASHLMLSSDEYLAFDGFAPMNGPAPGADATFEITPDAQSAAQSSEAGASGSPTQTGSVPTLRAGGQSPGVFDGATPSAPRAVALGSTTPVGAEQTPIEIIASARSAAPASTPLARVAIAKPQPNATVIERNGERPNYTALIDNESGAEERCLAEAVYFEARSEPEDGQAAVAQVVLNRVKSGLYPPSICGVVYQNRQRRNACQFSFACEGKPLRVTEGEPWKNALRIAHDVLAGDTYLADVGGATHYHANYVRPRWASSLKKMDVIGHHIFYAMRTPKS